MRWGQGPAGLAQALDPAWRDTAVVVLSEFGRTFRENGNRGTDHGHGHGHGHGTVYWVLGGLFQRLRGLRPAQVEAVFPGSRPVDLRLL